MLVQWQKDFEVGHPPTDAAHREVADLINDLDVSVATGSPAEAIDRTLDALAQALASHLPRGHDALGHVYSLRRGLRDGTTLPDRGELRALAHWWLGHLCGQDAAIPCAPAKSPSH